MGWIGIPCDSRPSNREINWIVQQRMETPTCRIIDRSAWQAHDRHRFLLMEAEPRVETDKAIRFIVVILVKYHQHELLYKEVEESMGPNELDSPMRIMNQLEGHPPTGGYSARWRERILQHHQDMKPREDMKPRDMKPREEVRLQYEGCSTPLPRLGVGDPSDRRGATTLQQRPISEVLPPSDASVPGPQPTHRRRHQAGAGERAGMS